MTVVVIVLLMPIFMRLGFLAAFILGFVATAGIVALLGSIGKRGTLLQCPSCQQDITPL